MTQPKKNAIAKKDGNVIFQSLSRLNRQLLSGAESIALEQSTFTVAASRAKCEQIYRRMSPLISDLRSVAGQLATFNYSVCKVDIFDTDNDIRYVAFELKDDRLL